MWMYDFAREQCENLDFLRRLCRTSLDSGYDALGLYFEHRFAYPRVPWVHGKEGLQPETIRQLRREFPELRLIPFANLLGHMEGFLYCEEGRHMAEEQFKGLQGCASNSDFQKLCRDVLEDVLETFDDELVHLGGDETAQLCQCPECSKRSRADLYWAHFEPLMDRAKEADRRVGLWADMILEHSTSASEGLMALVPKDTLLFDWQYFEPFDKSAPRLKEAGYGVIACPSVQTYSAFWCHRTMALDNAGWAQDAVSQGWANGTCLTTWECGLFGNYETLLPIVSQIGRRWNGLPDQPDPEFEGWATLMDETLRELGGVFALSGHRHKLKSRLLLYGNPFLAWMYHAQEFTPDTISKALHIAEVATATAPGVSFRGFGVALKLMVEFMSICQKAAQFYAERRPGEAATALAPGRQIFDELEKIAVATHLNAGGSLADIERCRAAKHSVESVMRKILQFGDGSLGYLPSFESLVQPQFMPHDQGCWWRVNSWGMP